MEALNCMVTTTYNDHPALAAKGKAAAERLALPFLLRKNRSIEEMKQSCGVENVLLATQDGWKLHTPGGEMYFHLNMAHLRIKNLRTGQGDHMARAMRLESGMSVLDCTLGLASDAIVASFIVGDGGKVTGVEASPLIALIVRDGLQAFATENVDVESALKRIAVVQSDAWVFLASLPEKSYDIVYFDPMFRHPIQESVALGPMRFVADSRAVEAETLAAARRVARKRVVLKENSRSGEFARLGFECVTGGKYSSVHYGVMEIDEKR